MLPRNKNLNLLAKELRKSMTKQEKHLWYDFLCNYPIRFYRQKIIGNYIVDFYCDKAKLIVELDGSQHYENKGIEHDKIRTDYMNSLDIEVIRFSNHDCDFFFDGICMNIDLEVNKRLN